MSVVDALARALRLDRDEHDRLRFAAGFAALPRPVRAAIRPGPDGGRVPREITPSAQRMLDRLTEVPTCLCDAAPALQ